jgi:hypothetical protein
MLVHEAGVGEIWAALLGALRWLALAPVQGNSHGLDLHQ